MGGIAGAGRAGGPNHRMRNELGHQTDPVRLVVGPKTASGVCT
jgi:hypothetical protein